MEPTIRINKFLADKGYATRRGADALIVSGKVFVNGKKAVLGQQVSPNDTIEVKSKKKKYDYLLYYKPSGIITHSPDEGETDIVMDLKSKYDISGVFPVGRLDKASEGLMLLTNDGRVTDRILNPEKAHEREYRVTVDKKVSNHLLKHLEHGVNIEGYVTKPAKVKSNSGAPTVFSITLTEGKKHQIRRMCAALGFQVKKLVRTKIANLTLSGLQPGEYRKLTEEELKVFCKRINLPTT